MKVGVRRIGHLIYLWQHPAMPGIVIEPVEVNKLVHDLLEAGGMTLKVLCQPKDWPNVSTDGPHGGKAHEG
jgi:hypothetical protein